MKRVRVAGLWLIPATAIVLIAAVTMALFLDRDGDRITLRSQNNFSIGSYYAYVQPWGAQSYYIGRLWGEWADSIGVDTETFPNRTRIDWRWPPFSPGNGVGVWGYNHLGYGNYDGGESVKQVVPKRVRDIGELRSEYAWNGNFDYGDASLLLEFYLRSDPADSESKVIEIGWFLHVPDVTRQFVAGSKQIGTYIDPQGRKWRVAMEETFCTFSLVDGQDTRSGSVDMLHALGWLRTRGLVKGDEWLTGVALGAEPVSGVGHVEIERWKVTWK